MTEPPDENAALRWDDARRLIDAAIRPVIDTETIALHAALGRVLANDLVSQVDVPAHDNAAMDGYAFRAEASTPARNRTGTRRLRVVGQALAGEPFTGSVASGECVRVMTGAMMPLHCDAVVPQEETTSHGNEVEIAGDVRPGQHRRCRGEDLASGAIAIPRGRRITPSDLGLAASIGAAEVPVVRWPRVAIFSTGTELRAAGEALAPGCVHDSNRYALMGMLERLGVEVIDMGIVRDDRDALEAALTHACSDTVRADAIVTSGGVSGGDADYTREVMRKIGRVSFWKLAIKPGRPMAFGRVEVVSEHATRSALLFGLPGNPVSTMVVFYALVREALLKLSGAHVEPLPCLRLICDAPLKKPKGRTEFVRGIAYRRDDGWHVRTTGAQGSGILRSMSEANCLIVLDHDRSDVATGEVVEAWPFDGLT